VLTCSRQPFDPRCPWPGGEENHIQIDLADPNRTIAAIETIKEKAGGRVDALVNNAGISPKGAGGARLDTLTTDLRTWGHVFHVNFFASVILARGLKDELTAARGSIVNVTSIAGARVHPFAGAAYATSKAALAALTREMAHDFGPLGVRVNAIAPGEVETSILSPGTEKIVEKPAAEAPGPAEGGGRRDLVPVFGPVQLHFRRRDRGERRAARLTPGTGIFKNSGPISSKKSAPQASVAMMARRVSIPSPFSELVTTISG
jgi:NAD(P)-dependent dehydrogenase (short-subunit alcohol dehydrogenase family)